MEGREGVSIGTIGKVSFIPVKILILRDYFIWFIGIRTGKMMAKCHFLGSMLPQYMALCVSLFCPKHFYATSKQDRRLRFS